MNVTTMARAWSLRRGDGLVLGFTDHDGPLAFDGIAFRPDRGLTARALVQGTGLSVDNSEATGALSDDAITERDLMAGRWDAAELRLWEVDWTDVAQRRLVFRGSLGEVSRSNGAFRAELRGLSDLLNAPQGRVYHPRCSARLGDGACRVDLGASGLSVDRSVEGLEEGRVFRFAAFPAFDANWFEHGRLEVRTGAAEGLQGAIKNDSALPGGGRVIELWSALGLLPAPGDQLRLTAGCDKAATSCRLKFGNFANFRGFPHLPPEDWLLAPQVNRHG
ncbi:DUF2163 domain-containing protein [Paracoccus liaowanqingii]|uniref:DUF2163 domain-containing protein n=1 Tax=Paracoccus liaowanqingii TaxID=2560053 RepID=A0A4Z1CD24_9RHOB|nr:DUF2163 domain-containing protein [Paracoccus liaowanqingii]TGN42424.1 DUF2163 domain-containing protein [Paracoccus liaowanqingii]